MEAESFSCALDLIERENWPWSTARRIGSPRANRRIGQVIARVRARVSWAAMRAEGKRVVECPSRLRTAKRSCIRGICERPVYIGNEQGEARFWPPHLRPSHRRGGDIA
jgi:hypothetical protein